MKSYLIPTLALGLLVSSVTAQNKPDLTSPKQRSSYALGMNLASNLKQQDLEVDPKAFTAGVFDALTGAKPALNEEELKQALDDLRNQMMAKAKAEQEKYGDGEKNLKEGEKFLAENAKKDGVKTTASGLQYLVLKHGNGESPKPTDTVKVNYHGTLIDGTVFDSSVERGKPVEFELDKVIPGWTEGLQLMKVGDKFRFFIPPKLAYGEHGRGGKIGPNSTLIFDVELLAITKAN